MIILTSLTVRFLGPFIGDMFFPKGAHSDIAASTHCCKWETKGNADSLQVVGRVAYVLYKFYKFYFGHY